jgi:hypothetical protein
MVGRRRRPEAVLPTTVLRYLGRSSRSRHDCHEGKKRRSFEFNTLLSKTKQTKHVHTQCLYLRKYLGNTRIAYPPRMCTPPGKQPYTQHSNFRVLKAPDLERSLRSSNCLFWHALSRHAGSYYDVCLRGAHRRVSSASITPISFASPRLQPSGIGALAATPSSIGG